MAPPQAVPVSFFGSSFTTDPINFPPTGNDLLKEFTETPARDLVARGPQTPFDARCGQSGERKQPLTFRNSKIIYYGPHACKNCGSMICRMGREWGGNSFDYPTGPIYPNTEWHAHICDPVNVHRYADLKVTPRE